MVTRQTHSVLYAAVNERCLDRYRGVVARVYSTEDNVLDLDRLRAAIPAPRSALVHDTSPTERPHLVLWGAARVKLMKHLLGQSRQFTTRVEFEAFEATYYRPPSTR